MYYEAVDGSIAHVTMLAAQGIVTEEESKRIIERLHDTYERMDLCPLGAGIRLVELTGVQLYRYR